jgi:isoamylase
MIPGTDEYRFNFWGYSTVNFFSPMARYSQVAPAGRAPQLWLLLC